MCIWRISPWFGLRLFAHENNLQTFLNYNWRDACVQNISCVCVKYHWCNWKKCLKSYFLWKKVWIISPSPNMHWVKNCIIVKVQNSSNGSLVKVVMSLWFSAHQLPLDHFAQCGALEKHLCAEHGPDSGPGGSQLLPFTSLNTPESTHQIRDRFLTYC